ncbi:MAG TPA: response regulator [Verrucomicrobiae bacterium]
MHARHKLLIVDDDPAVLELYRELLSHLPSQPEVFTATSGPRALALLKAEPFRLLLCDLKMPKMDGLQVLSICRRTFPDLRTVVVTAVENEEFRSRAYALGVDLFWLKPDTQQNMQMFLQCVEALLGMANDSGFRGVQSKGLLDLLQMECLAQSSTVLRIRRGGLTGQIWIIGGELIDAETEGTRGEAAFRRILSWKSGTFENMPPEPSRERTIFKPFNALLLETAQVLDESVSAPPAAEQAGQPNQHNTVWRLASLTRAGADYVVAMDKESGGRPEGWGTESTDELAEWIRVAFDAAADISQKLQTGPLLHAEGGHANHRFVMMPHEHKVFLVGWPAGAAKHTSFIDATKQLVASWDS